MLTSAAVVLLIIVFAIGATSASLLGRLIPPLSLGSWTNALLGGIGGIGLTWLAGQIPGVEHFVEDVANPVSSSASLSPELIAGVGVAGLLGGAFLVAVLGLIRNRLNS